MKKSFILLLLAGAVSAASAASLKINLGSSSAGDSDWISVATQASSITGGKATSYASIASLSKNGGDVSPSVVLGNLDGQDVTLTMAYKSTAAMNAGYLDATGTSPSLNSLFPDSMAQSSISGKCNGVKGQTVGLQFTLSGLAANTTYYLYVLGNSGFSTNKTSMTLSGGVSNVTGSLMDGYEGAGTVAGSTFQGTTDSSGVGMEWAFTTNSAGQVTLTYERAAGVAADVLRGDLKLNGFMRATEPIPAPATESLGLLG
ncbi:hypothetical protein, partial [Akkermansia sp.]|uniref:hypothetical protein n=1 Tax=Akkermansia sp. TaxID=1872421 RepID=UPI0025BBB870